MKCKVCGSESGKYPLCSACNSKKEKGEIIKCEKCGNWHYANTDCPITNSENDNSKFLYDVKKSLISSSEQRFYRAIKSSVPDGFCVFPQVNLASFINRTDDMRFHNELFRNVDFLITNADYQPLFIIEINDQTHLNGERKSRDEKVKNICEEAGIPILTLWTSYGINTEYIKKRIDETINSLPVERKHHFNKLSDSEQNQTTSSTQNIDGLSHLSSKKKNGCYIATCVYGSYDCPEVWVLRRFRDNSLSNRFWGRVFINAYYAFSPTLVKHFGNTRWFVRIFKVILDKVVAKLKIKGFDSAPYKDKY